MPLAPPPQRKVVAYEALARLKVGDAVYAPETFLPVLERHGRTTALDRRMLQRVATIARVLTWERALRSAWEQGEALDERWTAAPAETLATLL